MVFPTIDDQHVPLSHADIINRSLCMFQATAQSVPGRSFFKRCTILQGCLTSFVFKTSKSENGKQRGDAIEKW